MLTLQQISALDLKNRNVLIVRAPSAQTWYVDLDKDKHFLHGIVLLEN